MLLRITAPALAFLGLLLSTTPTLACTDNMPLCSCSHIGVTQMSEDHANIIACMLVKGAKGPQASCENSDGGCIWKTMTTTLIDPNTAKARPADPAQSEEKFGGLYQTSKAGCTRSARPNPYTATYGCPSGYKDTIPFTTTAPNACGNGQDQMILHLCTKSAVSEAEEPEVEIRTGRDLPY